MVSTRLATVLPSETTLLLNLLKDESIAKQLNGHRNREGWRAIQSRLKQNGYDRTIEQIKNRHRSIRQTYIRVKDNNRRTGTSQLTSQFHGKYLR
jgi:Myb/SANT-like DNA-binding domain